MDDGTRPLRDELESLEPLPESPHFFDELWRRANAVEQAKARRWRRAAMCAGVVAIAAVASAAALATSSRAASRFVDLRVQCPSQLQGGLPVFQVHSEPGPRPDPNAPTPHPPAGFKPVAGLWVATGPQTYFTLSSLTAGFTVDRRNCTEYTKRIDLGHSGLTRVGTYRYGGYTTFTRRCVDVARLAFRVRIASDSNGLPTHAQIAIVRAKTGTPLVYVDWTPDAVVGYESARCEPA